MGLYIQAACFTDPWENIKINLLPYFTGENRALNITREFPITDKENYSQLIYIVFSTMCCVVRRGTRSLDEHLFILFILSQAATRILFLYQSDSPIKFLHVTR